MPRLPLPLLAIGFTATAALALAACGGEDAKLLPGETAREITANLDTVQQLSDEGDCLGAESAAQQVGEQIAALQGVDIKLKRALEEGAVRLEEVIASCEESTTEAIAEAGKAGKGVIVQDVKTGSFAEDVGLARGDIILEVNKQPVNSEEDFARVESGLKSGQDVVFLVRQRGTSRQDGTIFLPGTLP